MTNVIASIESRIAQELSVKIDQVTAAIKLLDEGSTVAFISRYRKEATGGLDDEQIRTLEERLKYMRELDERRMSITKSIEEQGKMTDELLASINSAVDKSRLEDLYLPYKQKRRTKATLAVEAGLLPLAEVLLANPKLDPLEEAKKYIRAAFKTDAGENPGVPDVESALLGAKFILLDKFSEDADLLLDLRTHMSGRGLVGAAVVKGKEAEGEKFKDYFSYVEAFSQIPSHRALALLRGEREGVLSLDLRLEKEKVRAQASDPLNWPETAIARKFNIRDLGRAADKWLTETVRLAWRSKLSTSIETDLLGEMRERADKEAINVFARNLKELLLAAPAGHKVTLGLDPGLRTGVKVAVVDSTGKVLDHTAIYPHEPKRDWNGSKRTLAAFIKKYGITLVSVGNGTASRETAKLAHEIAKEEGGLMVAIVSEAGASVYSASEFASKELPGLDVTIRGAVSIARRLQDPLAELVKIDPKSIGVGQYQHDVDQKALAEKLTNVVEDCVNAVGVDVNTASSALLGRVSGFSSRIADSLVKYRDQHGAFATREDLREVPYLGDKAFEQSAGFLRIANGKNPLDSSAVHPESYVVVEKILKETKMSIKDMIGNTEVLRKLDPKKFADEQFGVPTVTDIIGELEKPGRDPRGEFSTATFLEGVEDMKDLSPGMILEGVVTNVAAFGAFVDIGVHQDGLVHISQLSNSYVSDPHKVVRAGQVVKVKVVEVEASRKRIALTMKGL
jgi:uncharacterized protein